MTPSALLRLSILSLCCFATALFGETIQHPFMVWTPAEAAALRKRVETEPAAKAQYEALLALGKKDLGKGFRSIFQIQVMGDEAVAAAEKKHLLGLIGVDPRKWKGDTGGGRHFDQSLNVLRYDVLYDRLTEKERADMEATFRDFIKHHCEEETLTFTRTSWLPNMQWPRPITAHLMAVALRDEKLIRQCFNSRGGWKYFFDDYLADGRFYGEEFGKQYSMIGEMFLWCRGVERLGLGELGYGYTGKGGTTMRRYVESIIEIGYPRTNIPGGMPQYPLITMGDARGSALDDAPPYVFQKSMVTGYLPDGTGGNDLWSVNNMNGRDYRNAKVEKMLAPQWFELAHVKWPDGPFAYFLAQMRAPGEARYEPGLYWGCEPIDPAKVKPPAAPSYVARERGFAFLRADESPGYWEGPAPAVPFQFATYYVHYAHDAFCLLGLNAFNRPIYLNRQISNGYGGGDLWTDSPRGLCGVMVDNQQYQLDETDPKFDHPHWPNPIGEVPVRSAFGPLVKFVAADAKPVGGKVTLDNRQPLASGTLSLEKRREELEVWPGVGLSRALFLTKEYLFDVIQLTSDKPHRYDWQVQALGLPKLDAAWKASADLTLDRLYDTKNRAVAARLADPVEAQRFQMSKAWKLDAGAQPWAATIVQSCAQPDPAQSVLGKAWFDRGIGVRVHMLAEPGTVAYAGLTPESRPPGQGKERNKGERSQQMNEVGGTTLLVSRQTANTVFAALHEPFEKATPRIESFRRIEKNESGLAVAITTPKDGIDDRILYRHWPSYDQPLTLAGEGESFTFADRAFIRIGADAVRVEGDLRAMKVKVTGQPKLILNGKVTPAAVVDGMLRFGL